MSWKDNEFKVQSYKDVISRWFEGGSPIGVKGRRVKSPVFDIDGKLKERHGR